MQYVICKNIYLKWFIVKDVGIWAILEILVCLYKTVVYGTKVIGYGIALMVWIFLKYSATQHCHTVVLQSELGGCLLLGRLLRLISRL